MSDTLFNDGHEKMLLWLHQDIDEETESLIQKYGGNPVRLPPKKGIYAYLVKPNSIIERKYADKLSKSNRIIDVKWVHDCIKEKDCLDIKKHVIRTPATVEEGGIIRPVANAFTTSELAALNELLRRKSSPSIMQYSKLAERFPRHSAEQWKEKADEILRQQTQNNKTAASKKSTKSNVALLKKDLPKKSTHAKKQLAPIKSIKSPSKISSSSKSEIKYGTKEAKKLKKNNIVVPKSPKKIMQEIEEDEDTVKAGISSKSAAKRPAIDDELSSSELESEERAEPSTSVSAGKKKKKTKRMSSESQTKKKNADSNEDKHEPSNQEIKKAVVEPEAPKLLPVKEDSVTIINEVYEYDETNRGLKSKILAQLKNPESPIRIIENERASPKRFHLAAKKLKEPLPKKESYEKIFEGGIYLARNLKKNQIKSHPKSPSLNDISLKPLSRSFDSSSEKNEITAFWKEVEEFQAKHDIDQESCKNILFACSGHFDVADKLVEANGVFSKVPANARDFIFSAVEDDQLLKGKLGIHSKDSAIDRLSFLGFDVFLS